MLLAAWGCRRLCMLHLGYRIGTPMLHDTAWPPRTVCAGSTYLTLHCHAAGDSRAVLCRGGRALQLSDDHKPNRPDEMVSGLRCAAALPVHALCCCPHPHPMPPTPLTLTQPQSPSPTHPWTGGS